MYIFIPLADFIGSSQIGQRYLHWKSNSLLAFQRLQYLRGADCHRAPMCYIHCCSLSILLGTCEPGRVLHSLEFSQSERCRIECIFLHEYSCPFLCRTRSHSRCEDIHVCISSLPPRCLCRLYRPDVHACIIPRSHNNSQNSLGCPLTSLGVVDVDESDIVCIP